MKRQAAAGNRTQDTWLVRQPDNHQPPQSSICTAQVGLKCLSCNTWQPLSMCRQNSVRGRPEKSLHQERTHAKWFSQSKCLELLPHVGINRSLDVMLQLRHFSPTCAVHIEDCGGWWLSGCRSSVAEHWLHKPGVLGSIPGGCRPFHFPLFSPHNI